MLNQKTISHTLYDITLTYIRKTYDWNLTLDILTLKSSYKERKIDFLWLLYYPATTSSPHSTVDRSYHQESGESLPVVWNVASSCLDCLYTMASSDLGNTSHWNIYINCIYITCYIILYICFKPDHQANIS